MYLDIVNATLLSITTGGTIEDYDVVAGTDPIVKFQGNVDAQVIENVLTNIADGGEGGYDKIKDTRIIIPGDMVPNLILQSDDTVTYLYDNQTFQRQVMQFSTVEVPGVQPTVTIHFKPVPSA